MKTRKEMRAKRKLASRVLVHGSASRPRLAVYRSNTRISAQVIDDDAHTTVSSAVVVGKNIEKAKELGKVAWDNVKSGLERIRDAAVDAGKKVKEVAVNMATTAASAVKNAAIAAAA